MVFQDPVFVGISVSTIITAVICSSFMLGVLLGLTRCRKTCVCISPSILVACFFLILIRVLLPYELCFTKTILQKGIINGLYDWLLRDTLLGITPWYWFQGIWVTGAITGFWLLYRSWREFKRYLRICEIHAVKYTLSPGNSNSLSNRPITVICSETVVSPFSVSFPRPAIYIPARHFTSEEKLWIMRHESLHLRFHHPAWNLGIAICNCILWWMLPLWIVPGLVSLAEEIQVDKRMNQKETQDGKAAYQAFLIREAKRKRILNVKWASPFSTLQGWRMYQRIISLQSNCDKRLSAAVLGGFLIAFCLSYAYVIEPDYREYPLVQDTFSSDDFTHAIVTRDGETKIFLEDGNYIESGSKQILEDFPGLPVTYE